MEVVLFSHVNLSYGIGRYAGVYRLATELRQNGFETQIVDFWSSLSKLQLTDILKSFITKKTLIVGFSTTLIGNNTQKQDVESLWSTYSREINSELFFDHLFHKDHEFVENLFELIKEINPNVKIVVGGRKLETFSKSLRLVDYWFMGESDLSLVALAKSLKLKTPFVSYPNLHKGKVRGKVVRGNTDYPVGDFSNKSIIWSKRDAIFPGEHLPVEISRGCAFRCKFCSFMKRKLNEYMRSFESLQNEFLWNYENFGVTGYMISDDTFNDSLSKVESFYRLSKNLPFKLEWSAYVRADMLYRYPEMIELIIDSGARSLFFGVETLKHKTGLTVGKGLHPEKVLKVIHEFKKRAEGRVFIGAGFIAGLPWESRTEIQKTFEYLVSDQSPFDGWNYNALFLKKRKSNDDKNEVAESIFGGHPDKYGYRMISEKEWVSNEMSYSQARELVDTFVKSNQWREKNRMMSIFNYYNRMRNLGMNHQKIGNLKMSESSWIRDALIKQNEIQNSYFKNILKLN